LVTGADTFLDLIAQQVLRLREKHSFDVRFMLMNSFSTSADTLELLRTRYPVLANDTWLEVVQNKAPKIEAGTNKPAAHPPNPKLEWAPPGHGDLYPTLRGSGMLRKLVAAGYKYMFISNSDNLGKALVHRRFAMGLCIASHARSFQQTHSKRRVFSGAILDTKLLTHFAANDLPFMMEVCARTENDKKGGKKTPPHESSASFVHLVSCRLIGDHGSFRTPCPAQVGRPPHPAGGCPDHRGGRGGVPGHLQAQLLQHQQPVDTAGQAGRADGRQGAGSHFPPDLVLVLPPPPSPSPPWPRPGRCFRSERRTGRAPAHVDSLGLLCRAQRARPRGCCKQTLRSPMSHAKGPFDPP
jgi:hypothetical protein